MGIFGVEVLPEAEEDLRKYIRYLKFVKQSDQAADNLMRDYIDTRMQLSRVAGSIRNPDSKKLRQRGLKRINFLRHNYFLLFKVEGNQVFVVNMFHGSEDYERKLH